MPDTAVRYWVVPVPEKIHTTPSTFGCSKNWLDSAISFVGEVWMFSGRVFWSIERINIPVLI